MATRFAKRLLKACGVCGGAVTIVVVGYSQLADTQWMGNFAKLTRLQAAQEIRPIPQYTRLPCRETLLADLQNREFDVLVIGGGATGTGVALDSVTRGLTTALVEKYDFSSGTSSRSTKLIHGGVRYLQKAVFNLDIEQYKMVKEALNERGNLCSQKLRSSYLLGAKKSLDEFPMLKKDKLWCSIVYYDGAQNDSRMNIALAISAIRRGATVANHTEVLSLLRKCDLSGKAVICGARCRNRLTGEEFDVKAKCVINATGPFTDSIRKMDNPDTAKICQPSAGIHIVLPEYYSPQSMGLLDPATSDGRVIFFLPWQGRTVAGTTDRPCDVSHSPCPTEKDIRFILKEIKSYLGPDIDVRRGDVLAAWAGIRPLVTNPNAKNTQSIARNHLILTSPSNLISIAGGKWTTYRSMAQETVDTAIRVCGLTNAGDCVTADLMLEGSTSWTPTMYVKLVQAYGLDSDVAKHLASTYGDVAFEVAKLARNTGLMTPAMGVPLAPGFPYIEAEVKFACRQEFALTTIDMVAHRMRLSFLNAKAAEEALPRVITIMGQELGWDSTRKENELEEARKYLYEQMGSRTRLEFLQNQPINLTAEEITTYSTEFHIIDGERKGFITTNNIRNYIANEAKEVTDQQIDLLMAEADYDQNGILDMGEFIRLMSAVKQGHMPNVLSSVILDKRESEGGSSDKTCGDA